MRPVSSLRADRPRVVIVDDSRTMQVALEQILSLRLKFDIVGIASDAHSAVSMIASLQPDVVTIDLLMPYIDGQELLRKLTDFPAIHKLVLSAHGCTNANFMATLKQLGADACIDKRDIARDPGVFCASVLKALAQPKPARRTSLDACRPRGGSFARAGAKLWPVPADEQARVAQLAALDIANDDEDAQLDSLVAHLGKTTDFPMCVISFINRDTQFIKAGHGFSRGAGPRAEAFCNYTLCSDDTFIVTNAAMDERFATHPSVTGGAGIRAYVGHPIVSNTGVRLGAICLLDSRPRTVTSSVLTNLRSICAIAAGILDARMPAKRVA